VRNLLRTVLMRSGYEVQTAGTAEEAIETMKASGGFDAVLSEASLPGMNGHELAWQLAVRYPMTKVIFVTATYVECETCSHAVQRPWIAKPFAPEELVRRVAEILAQSSPQSNISCQTCDELLSACKRSVREHMNFVLNVVGVRGDVARLASQDAARMARKCKENMDTLREHRRKNHSALAEKKTRTTLSATSRQGR
jgi:DNA-binding NtrC family response regulator